jgi:hypothetical protein
MLPVLACAQVDGILCTDGEGTFTSKFSTGVTVTVGASQVNGLASRSCEAVLSSHGKTVDVVEDAWQVDLDVMGADLEFGKPVVGFQFKKRDIDRQMTYAIYSLDRTPQLLRTITGGDFFSAADFNLDGHIEIRTGDAGAADGFEGIPFSSFDFAPTVFLRFEKDKLIDVSSEMQPEYDRTIAGLRASLDAAALREFKSTDGRLDSVFLLPAEKIHSLITTKIKVLEIVWCYLYDGREAEAWSALKEMWPASDIDRIRAAILEAQKRGIRKQVDGVSTDRPRLKIKRLHIYDPMARFQSTGDGDARAGAENRFWMVDKDPIPIYLRTEPSPGSSPFQHSAEVILDMRIDDAGKVLSAKLLDKSLEGPGVDTLLESASKWKFIPAYKNGVPVACGIRQIISLYH